MKPEQTSEEACDAPSVASVSSNSSNTSDLDGIPSEYICPLTLEILCDPVMDKQGINFERSAIAEWLRRGNTTHPLTREPLSLSKLVSNYHLKVKIEKWKRDQGIPVETADSPSSAKAMYGYEDDDLESTFFMGTIEAPLQSSLGVIWSERIALEEALARVQHEMRHPSSPSGRSRHRHSSSRRRRRHHRRNSEPGSSSSSSHRSPRPATAPSTPEPTTPRRLRMGLGRMLANIRGTPL